MSRPDFEGAGTEDVLEHINHERVNFLLVADNLVGMHLCQHSNPPLFVGLSISFLRRTITLHQCRKTWIMNNHNFSFDSQVITMGHI